MENTTSSPRVSLGWKLLILVPLAAGVVLGVISSRQIVQQPDEIESSIRGMGPSNKTDASLRLHTPSLSLVPQRKRGRIIDRRLTLQHK